MLERSLLHVGTHPFPQLFQLKAGNILALCWENSCLAPEFHQSRLQCKAKSIMLICSATSCFSRGALPLKHGPNCERHYLRLAWSWAFGITSIEKSRHCARLDFSHQAAICSELYVDKVYRNCKISHRPMSWCESLGKWCEPLTAAMDYYRITLELPIFNSGWQLSSEYHANY